MPSEKRIIIVEDDQVLRDMYTKLLSNHGYQVDGARDVNEAYGLLKKHEYHLMVLDIMLEGKQNGFDLLESVRRDPELKKIKVIILTNLDSEQKTAYDLGSNDYLVKNKIKPTDLVDKIDKLI